MNIFIPHITGNVITYLCLFVKWVPGEGILYTIDAYKHMFYNTHILLE